MQPILSGNVLWSFDFEVQNRNRNNDIGFHFSGVKPFHCHSGEITLTEKSIYLIGEDELTIPLSELTQLYLGFDEIYTPSLSKNLGLFWQPLRLTILDEKFIYLIIDYNMLGAKNKMWFDQLTQMLS